MRNRKRFIILLSALLSFSCVSFGKPIEVIYLIPANFTGGVIIIYNQPDGITPETTKDGTIIFQIPKDGLIKVKEPLERTAYKFSYYFVDEKGNRTPIEYLYPGHYVRNPGDKTSKSFDTISEDETNNKTFAMIHTTKNFVVGQQQVYLHNFMIGHPKDYDVLYIQTSDKEFLIQETLMNKSQSKPKRQKN